MDFDDAGRPHVTATCAPAQAPTMRRRLEEAFDQASLVPEVVGASAHRPPSPGESRHDGFRQVGPGLAVGSPAVATAIATVDRWLTAVLARFAPLDLAVPALVSTEVLERSGYLRSFPHHVTGCSIVDLRLEAVDAVAAGGTAAWEDPDIRPAPVALPPAACHHVYAYLADHRVEDPATYRLRATCGRYEPAGFGPYRLWSFQQRELVYVGTAGGARQFVTETISWITQVIETSPAYGWRLVPASDAFFTSRAAAGATFQRFADTKHELLATTPRGEPVALGSINLHRSYFGRRFGMSQRDGSPVHTACVGFGLERIAALLLECFGERPEDWPELAVPGRPG